jgi:hypothetical protein
MASPKPPPKEGALKIVTLKNILLSSKYSWLTFLFYQSFIIFAIPTSPILGIPPVERGSSWGWGFKSPLRGDLEGLLYSPKFSNSTFRKSIG